MTLPLILADQRLAERRGIKAAIFGRGRGGHLGAQLIQAAQGLARHHGARQVGGIVDGAAQAHLRRQVWIAGQQ